MNNESQLDEGLASLLRLLRAVEALLHQPSLRSEIYSFKLSSELGGNDALRIRELIALQQTTVCEPLDQMKEALTQKLEVHIQQENAALLYAKALTSPLRRIPPEILSVIVEFHVFRNQGSVWTFMHVCRAWRIAAIGTSRLWKAICLGHPPLTDVPPYTYIRCASEEQLQAYLKYSESRLTDLRVGQLPVSQLKPLLDLVHRHKPTIKLRLYSEPPIPGMNQLPNIQWDFSELQQLFTVRRQSVQQAVRQSTTLRTLATTTEVASKLDIGNGLPRLQRLILAGASGQLPRRLLVTCTSLHTLALNLDYAPIVDPPIELPSLVKFCLVAGGGVGAEWPVNSPKLRELEVATKLPNFSPTRSITLMQLETITCSHSSPLLTLVAPHLEKLVVETLETTLNTSLQYVLNSIWPPRLPNDQHASMLRLDPVCLDIAFSSTATSMPTFIGYLCRVTRLTKLRIRPGITEVQSHIDLFYCLRDELMKTNPPAEKGGVWDIPLKQLYAIQISFGGETASIPFSLIEFDMAATSFLNARKRLGFPFNEVRLDYGPRVLVQMTGLNKDQN